MLFALHNVLAYIFLVGLYLFGFSLAAALYTPLMDSLAADSIDEITASALMALKIMLSIPVILHVIRSIVRGIKAGIKLVSLIVIIDGVVNKLLIYSVIMV